MSLRQCLVGACLLSMAGTAHADPCGMVPPIYTGQGPAITRVGEQMTYVFFKDGVETFVIRPGFSGKVDNFGMLIPFPGVPEIRKVPDEIFQHIGAAVDPPEIVIDLRPPRPEPVMEYSMAAPSAMRGAQDEGLSYDTVRVIKQEAIGMYEVTVLEAGGPKALKRWMDQNGYKYPAGMDAAVSDYIGLRWPFVAVKTRVGSKPQVKPRPGMRQADPQLPAGASFDGKVQGMGFRFRVKDLVVPMRLSAFNEGQLRNIVYVLTEDPVRINGLDKKMVKRQVAGKLLKQSVNILPVRIIGGDLSDVSPQRFDSVFPQRDPRPHNGQARILFASDLYALRTGKLSLAFEETEKTLLRIGEALNLRGENVDRLHHDALEIERGQTLSKELDALEAMTLTVVDGKFPRDYIKANDLTFAKYEMPEFDNNQIKYNARNRGPGYSQGGVLVRSRNHPSAQGGGKGGKRWWKF